jgi:hypothetical protein
VTSGEITYSGVSAKVTTEHATAEGRATGTAYGPAGTTTATATATGWAQAVRTEYIPWSATRPYYQARYSVRFATVGTGGSPRITADVKELTLHIITPNGEQSVTYKLPARKRSR